MNITMYKNTLSQKSVEELVEIILRKDDKEREKNKLISNLERRISGFKGLIATNDQMIKDHTKEIRDLSNKVLNLTFNRDNLKMSYDICRKQNTVLRLFVSILGAVVIIESLILIFS